MVGSRGWVYINRKYQGTLDLSAITQGGAVAALVWDQHDGKTRYEDFTVWKWGESLAQQMPDVDASPVTTASPTPNRTAPPDPLAPSFGPISGSIRLDGKKNDLETFRGLTLSGDVMIEATFFNPPDPYGKRWNYGILFQGAARNVYRWIYIDSAKGWHHQFRSGDDKYTVGARRNEYFHYIDDDKGGQNHLRLLVIDETGWLFINDRYVTRFNVNLGDVPHPDRISLVSVNRGEPDDARIFFEDFTVWKWDPSLYELPKDDN